MKIGDTIWIFDGNHRVYRKGPDGRSTGGPIWREHWRPYAITSETSRSWVVGEHWCQEKVPKKNASKYKFAFSLEEIEERAWVIENVYTIAEKVRRTTDADKLRAVAKIVGE